MIGLKKKQKKKRHNILKIMSSHGLFCPPNSSNPPKYSVFIYKQQKRQILMFEYIFFLAFLPKNNSVVCSVWKSLSCRWCKLLQNYVVQSWVSKDTNHVSLKCGGKVYKLYTRHLDWCGHRKHNLWFESFTHCEHLTASRKSWNKYI